MHSHGIIEHNILFGEFQQHRIIEELADAHVFTQALWRTEPDTRVTEPRVNQDMCSRGRLVEVA